jgi:phosphosulfolactate synthase
MSDSGIGVGAQRDLLEAAAGILDFAKIAVGISGCLPDELLRAKTALYREANVDVFPGGMFLERAYASGLTDRYLAEAEAVGFTAVEVSDNVIDFAPGDKQRIIEQIVGLGLTALAEVGKKAEDPPLEMLIDDARRCLAAGARKVLVEAVGLLRPGGEEMPRAMVDALGADDLVFEVPIDWIQGVHRYDRHRLQGRLLAEFGPLVNVANMEPQDLYRLEALRRGVGTDSVVAVDGGAR